MADELNGITRGWGRRLLSSGRIAASAARLAARRVVGADGERDATIGETLARELDQMKGMAMKVGQILSYFDGVLPEQTHAALRALQKGARVVRWEPTMAAVVADAFGQPADEVFESLDPEPVAAASIGQVYRGRHDGRDVAIKVQYPGIRDTIEGDFSRLQSFSKLASVASAVDGPAIVHELRERFGEECDYLLEARHQDAFREAFQGEPRFSIPEVFHERTRTTVITTAWCEGDDFYRFQERATRARVQGAALTLARFAYRSLYELGTLNADPHPGNYLFPRTDDPDGPVVFLDFGCVRRFDPDFLEAERRLCKTVLKGDRSAFPDALMASGMIGKARGYDYDHHWAMLRHELSPYLTPRFRFTRDYIKRGMDFGRPTSPIARKMAIPPQWIWLQRLRWGLHMVLVRLGAEGPFADVFRKAIETPCCYPPRP